MLSCAVLITHGYGCSLALTGFAMRVLAAMSWAGLCRVIIVSCWLLRCVGPGYCVVQRMTGTVWPLLTLPRWIAVGSDAACRYYASMGSRIGRTGAMAAPLSEAIASTSGVCPSSGMPSNGKTRSPGTDASTLSRFRVLPTGSPGAVVKCLWALDLDSGTAMLVRQWCRLQCGLPRLCHLGGRASAARYRDCIFCGHCVKKPVIHCIGLCPHWHEYRMKYCAAAHLVPSDSYLNCTVGWMSRAQDKAVMEIVFEWAAAIDIATNRFWKPH
jgi:hypothetical protein